MLGPGYWLSWMAWFVAIVVLCALMSCKNRYPLNMIGLFAFTCLISSAIGLLCVLYY